MKKVTVIFENEELYTAIKVEAARLNRHLKDVVREALEVWLEVQEDAEDAILAQQALAEYREKGGVPWGEVCTRARAILEEREREEQGSKEAAKRTSG